MNNIREGGLRTKFLKTFLWEYGWPQRSARWAIFLVGFRGPRPFSASVVVTPIFPPKICFFFQKCTIFKIMISHQQFTWVMTENSLLSSHEKFQPDWPKNVCHIIISIWNNWYFDVRFGQISIYFRDTKFIRQATPNYTF